MIFAEKFISAKVESAKIVFGEIDFRRKWNWRNSSSAKMEITVLIINYNSGKTSAFALVAEYVSFV
jgi:hypothetical protein